MRNAEQKRRNDKAMKERMEKMAEQQRKQELETQRRQKLREARERKLAKEKAEKDAIEAERMRKAEEDAKQVKLQPGLLRQGSAANVDDTRNLHLYDGTCLKLPWDTAPTPLVNTVGDVMDALAYHFSCDAVVHTCGIYVDTEPMDIWNRRGPLPPEKRLRELFFEWRAGNPGEKLRQKQEDRENLEHTIEANTVMIAERGDVLVEMMAYASEAEIAIEKAAIAKLDKGVKKAKADIITFDQEIIVMEKELEKIDRMPPKRLRLAVRQVAGAPVNNPKITQLCYCQAFALACRGYYTLDMHTIPLLGALHLQITHGDDDRDVMYQRMHDRAPERCMDEVALWALCRITHPRKGDSANFMHISDEELEYHSNDPAGNAAYRSGHPSEIGLRFGHYCPKHAMSKWAKVFKLAWTPLRQYQPTRARRHFIDLLERKCATKHPHYGLNLWPALLLPTDNDTEITYKSQDAQDAAHQEFLEDVSKFSFNVILMIINIQAVVRGNRARKRVKDRRERQEPVLAQDGVDGAVATFIGLDQGGLALYDPVTLRRIAFPGAEPKQRQVTRLQHISPLPADTRCDAILDLDDEPVSYTLHLTDFDAGRRLKFETAAGAEIMDLLHSLMDARRERSSPSAVVSCWEEEHQVHAEARPYSDQLSRRTYRLANFKAPEWHGDIENYTSPLKELGLADGVRPKVPPMPVLDSGSDEEPDPVEERLARVPQLPELAPEPEPELEPEPIAQERAVPAPSPEEAPSTPRCPYRIVCVVGGPGSGRSTHCRRLAEEMGLRRISTGSLLREAAESGHPSSGKIHDKMEAGEPASDALVFSLLLAAMMQHGPDPAPVSMPPGAARKMIIIDGFPRDVKQAAWMQQKMGDPEALIFLDCTKDAAVQRVVHRDTAKDHARRTSSHNVLKKTHSAGRLYRPDNTEAAARAAAKLFERDTKPVLEAFTDRPHVVATDGSIDESYRAFFGAVTDAVTS